VALLARITSRIFCMVIEITHALRVEDDVVIAFARQAEDPPHGLSPDGGDLIASPWTGEIAILVAVRVQFLEPVAIQHRDGAPRNVA
jgi:hypothetical protein